ncbi:MAG: hypothetical protein MUF48_12015 [Pirellulaceae bacterium]|nr:hypothetical protein [Pirellulaceae bacterium]
MPEASRWRRGLAWGVHAYTALGLVAAAAMAVLLVQGGPSAFRGVFWLMLAATLIDATDGALARAVRVKEVLPHFDGRQLDYLIDFLTYAALPVLLLWRAAILPAAWSPWLLVPLLAGAYWFCQVDAKTSDGFFQGFPALWNVVAFYVYVIHFHVVALPAGVVIAALVVFGVLTVIPSRYVYSVHRGRLNLLSNVLAGIWFAALLWIVYRLPVGDVAAEARAGGGPAGWFAAVVLSSLLFPAYYLGVSWITSWRARPHR